MSFDVLKRGQVLARKYRVGPALAKGGYGVVYAAERTDGGGELVIKALHLDASKTDPSAADRFVREAAIAASLKHPNLVNIFDFGQTRDEVLYMAMERLHGQPLAAYMFTGPMEPFRALKILDQILGALAVAHDRGLVHRDLNPTNIFVCDPGSIPLDLPGGSAAADHIKILDFGVAKGLQDTEALLRATLTMDGTRVGTPGYMAPEMLRRGGEMTPTVDLYAAGIIGHELLTGEAAYEGQGMERAAAQAVFNPKEPPGFVSQHPMYPLMQQLMERDPEARCPSAEAALEQLRAVAAEHGKTWM